MPSQQSNIENIYALCNQPKIVDQPPAELAYPLLEQAYLVIPTILLIQQLFIAQLLQCFFSIWIRKRK